MPSRHVRRRHSHGLRTPAPKGLLAVEAYEEITVKVEQVLR